MVNEQVKLNKKAELIASQIAGLGGKTAPSSEKKNLPRGKKSLEVIARLQAQKKKEQNDPPDSESTDSDDSDSSPRKKTANKIDIPPITLEEMKLF